MREIKKIPSVSIKHENVERGITETLVNAYSPQMKQTNEYEHKITVRISSLLLDSLKNIITSNKAGGNFEYTNVSDLIRKALESYKDGMSLIAQRPEDQKRETSFRISNELRDFYQSLPDNTKSEIMERAISTYIKHKI
jgi:Arc/MetJ-type ribon-helix-helix transcriptional regulator